MKTIILYFTDHNPIKFTGTILECEITLANNHLYPGFVSWEDLSGLEDN